KDPDQAAETLIKLSDLLRFQLYDCSDDRIPIEKELDYVRNFIELEKLRRGTRVKVCFESEGQLAGFRLAPFLLIPFLENAFKFVSKHPSEPNEIRVKLTRFDGMFTALFYNTHDSQPRDNTVGGIGLKNVRRRLELTYPGRHQLTIQPKPDTFLVTLSVQVE